jgi:hypothetical protein
VTLPAPTAGNLNVWFKKPASGATVSGQVQLDGCYVAGIGATRVDFFVDSTLLNSDTNVADGMSCVLDSTKFANGSHQLQAVAYNASGASYREVISINVQNSGTPTPTPTPTPTNTAPSVSFTAPAVGATLSGQVNSTTCAVNATDDKAVTKVDFYLGSTLVTAKTAAPWQCAFDTTKFANGTQTLMARATDAEGLSSTSQRDVNISNVATPTPTPTPTTGTVDAADILGRASAETPFAQQSGYYGQVLGTYPYASSIPESGVNGSVLSNGETLRLGKQADPLDSTRKALAFQLSPNDPATSGSKRSEISLGDYIEVGKVYWIAYRVFVNDWGTLPRGDEALFGTQVHSSDHDRGLEPAFSIITTYNGAGRNMVVDVTWSTSSSPTTSNSQHLKYGERPIPFGRWIDFVFKFRESTGSDGFLQGWMDGEQIVDHKGPLGYNTPGFKDYAKFGYYNWGSFSTSRKVLLRAPTVVADPSGNKYDAATLRAHVNK